MTHFLKQMLCGSLLIAPVQAGGDHWKTYVNVRFQYQVCYPEDLLKAQREAPNSDGKTYVGKSGAKLVACGSNALGGTVSDDENSTSSELKGTSGAITYQMRASNWYVISGHNGSDTFYAKTFLDNDQYKSFQLTYSTKEASIYNEVAAHVNKCFVDLEAK